ncbi:hypothetical protein [Streptomyces sp. SID3212]|uniref:hypothetical protein n=1 Tax=Streptomyces sp. SID3212 TaxID=2690259 RepID=UPI0013710E9D|nr:hypothetical protein [Streptomyces sp. SID3212]MYV58038.1 hypothetical protein [Streptomyces sp. SID3212]
MKIDTDILRNAEGELVWADDNPSGYGVIVYGAGKEVSDKWLADNGLVSEDEPEPEPVKEAAKKAPVKKVAPKPTDKQVSGPTNNK